MLTLFLMKIITSHSRGIKMIADTIKRNGKTYKFVEVKEEVDSRVEEFLNWSNKAYCIEAVKRNGYALRFVKEQDKEICIEAVKQDGDALSYVKEQAIFEEITGLKIKKEAKK